MLSNWFESDICWHVCSLCRWEGTPAYLPPEVLTGQHSLTPGYEVDSWALGCLASFCLHGCPLYFGDREQVRTWMSGNIKYVSIQLQILSRWQVLDQIYGPSEPSMKRVHFSLKESSVSRAAADFVQSLIEIGPRRMIRSLPTYCK